MPINMQLIRKRAEEAERKATSSLPGRKVSWYKLKPDKQQIRVLPNSHEGRNVIPDGDIACVVTTHFMPNKQMLRCIGKTYPDKQLQCPICAAVYDLREWAEESKLGDDDMDRLLGQYKTQAKAYVNCIVRDDPATEVVNLNGEQITIPLIRVAALPKTIYNDIVSDLALETLSEEVFDPYKGQDLVIDKKGSMMTTTYKSGFKRPSVLAEDEKVVEAILQNMWDLGLIFKFPDKKHLDEITVAAQAIEAMATSDLKVKTSKPNGKIPSGASDMFLGGSEKPDCYTNYIQGTAKCKACPYNDPCQDDTDQRFMDVLADDSIAARTAAHEASTYNP
jgi:gp32 DNA binding protein like